MAEEAGAAHQGLAVGCEDEQALLCALEQAFDYRGDVTLTLTDGRVVRGFLFDRETGATLEASWLRVMAAEGGEKVRVGYGDISALEFTGRDMAHGKSWETWVKKYVEKKTAEMRAGGATS